MSKAQRKLFLWDLLYCVGWKIIIIILEFSESLWPWLTHIHPKRFILSNIMQILSVSYWFSFNTELNAEKSLNSFFCLRQQRTRLKIQRSLVESWALPKATCMVSVLQQRLDQTQHKSLRHWLSLTLNITEVLRYKEITQFINVSLWCWWKTRFDPK